jgi:putative tricarboxylic transport membrane protein
MILGPLAEEQMRRSLSISQGDPMIFVTHGISALLLGLTLVILILPIVLGQIKKRKQPPGATGEE